MSKVRVMVGGDGGAKSSAGRVGKVGIALREFIVDRK